MASVLQALVIQETMRIAFVPGIAWRSHSNSTSNADSSPRGFDPKTKRCATIRTTSLKANFIQNIVSESVEAAMLKVDRGNYPSYYGYNPYYDLSQRIGEVTV